MDDLSRLRIDGVKLPIWLRIVVVVALALLAAAASLFTCRWYVRPVTLSIAVGSLDGDAPKIISALASRLAVNNAPVRLKVVETSGAIESADAFSSGKTDLAVVRGDVGDPWRPWRSARLPQSSRRPGSFSDLAISGRGNQRSIHSMHWGEE